ncbi:hypothetical protein, partial [Arenibaculum pallidiluteum]|uniref:hypothetical protein n=1 Tax=Arenibaculum pallidiluteum TaxID=2812559 RepID=UPI001A961F60
SDYSHSEKVNILATPKCEEMRSTRRRKLRALRSEKPWMPQISWLCRILLLRDGIWHRAC